VAFAHGHVGVDDQVELDEGGAAGDARLEVVHLQRALGIGRDDVADADRFVRLHRLVHQPAERGARMTLPALIEDVERHQHGQQRIEPFQPVATAPTRPATRQPMYTTSVMM
jgi:hypothetical protein